MTTFTKCIDFETLNILGESGTTVVKLMMACNDLTLTNQALTDWKAEQREDRKSRQAEACRYFVRTQISHLHEGLKIIEELRKNSALLMLIERCDAQSRLSFKNLQEYLRGGAKYKRFEQLAGTVRSNVTFHYDESGKLIKRAIADCASRSNTKISTITRGSTAHLWHFKVADDIVDSLVVHQIWGVPRDENLREETDRVTNEVHQVLLWFVDFAGEFIWKYFDR